jgi:hypothetical protein
VNGDRDREAKSGGHVDSFSFRAERPYHTANP